MYAKYTVVLNELLKDENTANAIQNALSEYPLYVKRSPEEYIPSIVPIRSEVNQKLLDHYKYREIGFETVGRFIDELRIAMNEIMPYYNQKLFSLDQDYNILYNADYTRENVRNRQDTDITDTTSAMNNTSSTTGNDSSEIETTNTDASKHVRSDTPQTTLEITASNIDTVDYADQVNWNKSDATSTSNTSGETASNTEQSGSGTVNAESNRTEEETSLETVKGNYGMVSSQSLVRQYQEIMSNVVQEIITDRKIKELFMMVY